MCVMLLHHGYEGERSDNPSDLSRHSISELVCSAFERAVSFNSPLRLHPLCKPTLLRVLRRKWLSFPGGRGFVHPPQRYVLFRCGGHDKGCRA